MNSPAVVDVGGGQTSVDCLRFTALKWSVNILNERKMTFSVNTILQLDLCIFRDITNVYNIEKRFQQNKLIWIQKAKSGLCPPKPLMDFAEAVEILIDDMHLEHNPAFPILR